MTLPKRSIPRDGQTYKVTEETGRGSTSGSVHTPKGSSLSWAGHSRSCTGETRPPKSTSYQVKTPSLRSGERVRVHIKGLTHRRSRPTRYLFPNLIDRQESVSTLRSSGSGVGPPVPAPSPMAGPYKIRTETGSFLPCATSLTVRSLVAEGDGVRGRGLQGVTKVTGDETGRRGVPRRVSVLGPVPGLRTPCLTHLLSSRLTSLSVFCRYLEPLKVGFLGS